MNIAVNITKKINNKLKLKFRFDNFKTSVLVPVLVAFFITTANVLMGGIKPIDFNHSMFFYVVYSVSLGPVFEEFVFRGIVLGGTAFVFVNLLGKISENMKANKATAFAVALLFSSFLFSYLHGFNFTSKRFLSGIAYGALFLINKKNVLPCAVAHSMQNLLVWFIA